MHERRQGSERLAHPMPEGNWPGVHHGWVDQPWGQEDDEFDGWSGGVRIINMFQVPAHCDLCSKLIPQEDKRGDICDTCAETCMRKCEECGKSVPLAKIKSNETGEFEFCEACVDAEEEQWAREERREHKKRILQDTGLRNMAIGKTISKKQQRALKGLDPVRLTQLRKIPCGCGKWFKTNPALEQHRKDSKTCAAKRQKMEAENAGSATPAAALASSGAQTSTEPTAEEMREARLRRFT